LPMLSADALSGRLNDATINDAAQSVAV
jgi:hypothetical protein